MGQASGTVAGKTDGPGDWTSRDMGYGTVDRIEPFIITIPTTLDY
jgi:hypothetical protein